jgi:hypothetical protein
MSLLAGVTVNSLHPGVVLTDVWRNLPKIIKVPFIFIGRFFFKVCYMERIIFTATYLMVSLLKVCLIRVNISGSVGCLIAAGEMNRIVGFCAVCFFGNRFQSLKVDSYLKIYGFLRNVASIYQRINSHIPVGSFRVLLVASLSFFYLEDGVSIFLRNIRKAQN